MTAENVVPIFGIVAALIGLVAAFIGRRKIHEVKFTQHGQAEPEAVSESVVASVTENERASLAAAVDELVVIEGVVLNIGYHESGYSDNRYERGRLLLRNGEVRFECRSSSQVHVFRPESAELCGNLLSMDWGWRRWVWVHGPNRVLYRFSGGIFSFWKSHRIFAAIRACCDRSAGYQRRYRERRPRNFLWGRSKLYLTIVAKASIASHLRRASSSGALERGGGGCERMSRSGGLARTADMATEGG